jgi:hypothetical protein
MGIVTGSRDAMRWRPKVVSVAPLTPTRRRARRERPRYRAPEQRDELAALHSITSLAVESSVAGTVKSEHPGGLGVDDQLDFGRYASVRLAAFVTAPSDQQTFEASCGCAVTSNRLASITRFASALSTSILNGASSRVPATGASAISISRPSERYLISGVDGRWPAIGS